MDPHLGKDAALLVHPPDSPIRHYRVPHIRPWEHHRRRVAPVGSPRQVDCRMISKTKQKWVGPYGTANTDLSLTLRRPHLSSTVRATHFVYSKVDRTGSPYHTCRTERGGTGTALRGAHGAERDLASTRECGSRTTSTRWLTSQNSV